MTLKGGTADIFFDNNSYNGNVRFNISGVDRMPDGSPGVTTMATWTPSKGLNLTGKYLMPNSFHDFEQRTIKIGTKEVLHQTQVFVRPSQSFR